MIKIGLLGGTGKTGETVRQVLAKDFSAVVTLIAAPKRGESLNPLLAADVVIDFSAPEAVLAWLDVLQEKKATTPALVIGSTGWKLDTHKKLEALAGQIKILQSANFSIGIHALVEILRQISPLLDKFGYTPVITESHDRHKKDMPSGTALTLQRTISPMGPGNVQTHSIRAGETISDHEVVFYGQGDRLTLRHVTQDRAIFARGAIAVAAWLAKTDASTLPVGKILSLDHYFKAQAG